MSGIFNAAFWGLTIAIVPFLSYCKDKSTPIPFAHKLFKQAEYEKYLLFTELEKGNAK
jgi:hypothetical protein